MGYYYEFYDPEHDFKKVAECGYGLWQGEWEELFKFENEKNCEMI
mgnify:CR=1 FL=1